jgi:hypothetical protein
MSKRVIKCRTGKAGYRSPEQAKRAITRIRQSEDKRERTPDRYYECEFGPHFHLTAQAADPTPWTRGGERPPEPVEETPLQTAERQRDELQALVESCVNDGCQACMRSTAWARYRIERGLT